MKKLLRRLLWLLAATAILALIDVLTKAEVPYRLPATLEVLLRDADNRPIAGVVIDVAWMQEGSSAASAILLPTRVAGGTTDDSGTLTLTLDIPGTIRDGIVGRGLRWLGEDIVRRKDAVRTVLGRTVVRVQKAGWKPLSKVLAQDDVVRGLGAESWFTTRPELAMTIQLTMMPTTEEPK